MRRSPYALRRLCAGRPLAGAAGLAALALFAPAARAQTGGGLAVGVGAFTISGESRASLSPRAGLGARLWLEREVRAGLSVGAGVEYLAKGADGEAPADVLFPEDGPNETLVRLRFDHAYLEVPVYLAYAPTVRARVQPQVYAGPHVSFLQSAYARYGARGAALGEAQTDASIRSRDFGLTAGALVRAEAGAFGRLVVGAHASLGFQNLRRRTPALTARGVLVYAGVSF